MMQKKDEKDMKKVEMLKGEKEKDMKEKKKAEKNMLRGRNMLSTKICRQSRIKRRKERRKIKSV